MCVCVCVFLGGGGGVFLLIFFGENFVYFFLPDFFIRVVFYEFCNVTVLLKFFLLLLYCYIEFAKD